MDTADASESGAMTSSTDSDTNSVVSVIRNQSPPQQNGRPNVFTFPVPRTVHTESYAIASHVYVLIDAGKSMSADMRVMWYLKRLGSLQTVDGEYDRGESFEQCKVLSFIAREPEGEENAFNTSVFVMDAITHVYFLTPVNNMVYCLDMSPSNVSVDIQRGHVMLDEMTLALSRSIKGFIRPFIVPGSKDILFEPQVYVTVIVHTPFYTSLAQQVLVQGWLINNQNFNEFITTVTFEMNRLENALASTLSNRKTQKCSGGGSENIGISNCSHHSNEIHSDEKVSSIGNNNPDSGFINTLRYGMLAVRLLPRSSISNLIVITDGMITLADIQVLDSVLNQLRCIGVACSFLHVSSQFHPHSGHGHVPYSELMQLIATATSGTYLNSFPETIDDLVVNYYHDKFIMWSFKRGNGNESPNNTKNLSCTPTRVRSGEWTVRNSNFYGNRQTQLVSKKQISDHVQAHLDNIVCCRMREGFIIEDIQFKDTGNTPTILNLTNSSKLQLKFILPWTNHIYIEYDLVVKWPPVLIKNEPMVIKETTEIQVPSTPTTQPIPAPSPSPDNCLNIHYSVVVKGPYEFLHDITCNRNKKTQLQLQSSQKCQFQLSSCRSSSISVTAATTTITKNMDLLPDEPSNNTPRIVSSKYRQALIARFWSTMRSIVQTDLLIKHLETYSPSTGHLIDYNNSSLSRKQNENHNLQPQKIESPLLQQIENSIQSPNILNFISASKLLDITIGVTESKTVNFSTAGIPNRSPLRSGMPLFYHLPTNSNSFSIKQCQVKLNAQQQSYTDQQHQQFADFWKPVCSLDPDSQWPKWFSTYRIGGGVLLLRHDRPLPRWLHVANVDNGRYQTLTCRIADESLFALLKQWCTFVLIDDHSYVKCLDRSDTHSGNVSFCIARVSPRPPSCCCVVLHLGFQSCVPAFVHYKIIDELKNNIQLLDSTTAVKQPLHYVDNNELSATTSSDKKRNRKKKEKKKVLLKKKSKEPQRYVYFLDKPLEKILIRYEKIPTQFTTVIFPDGSQPYPAPAVKTSNKKILNSKPNSGKQNDTSREPSGVESKTVTTTTTLSRYLYHRRWIWSSGCSRYSKCNSNASQKLLLQLARTLSILTKIRLREGFKFAHSSSGIINMVLQVDMIEGSSSCPSTPTSHCVIQYVLFPPNIFNKHQLKDPQYANAVDMLKKKNNDDERRSSTSSIEDKQKSVVSLDAFKSSCCSQYNKEDDYQLIMECWIEPQHGSVVANKNNKYMSGLMYEQLADAMWQVDSDCISSLFTFQHMQHMCIDSNITVGNPDFDLDNNQQNKAVIVDDGRIYKLPFTFNLVNLLPKCRHYTSRTYSLFTVPDDTDTKLNSIKDEKKLNNMLERSFYSRLRVLNDRLFDVNDQNKSGDINPAVTKLINCQDIGQCFIKRVNDTRLILTVTPPFVEEKYNTSDNTSDDNLEPLGRSRANTWHYTKRGVGQSLSSCTQPQENSTHYYRTMSVGSKPYFSNTTDNISWTHLRSDSNLWPDINDTQNSLSDIGSDKQDTPTNMLIEVYDCRQEDVENVLMSDGRSFDHTVINDYTDDSNSCSSISSNSEDDGGKNVYVSNKKKIVFDQPDPLLLDKYFNKIQDVYDRSLVTTVFHALHLGLNVQYLDIQRAVERCHHRLITFDITDFLMVVCDHLKNNDNNCMICPADNKTLKAHHDMIHTTFSSTLDRHLLKPVPNHPYYYFYDFIDKLDYDDDLQENNYMNKLTSSSCKKKYLTAILGKSYNKTNSDSYEIDEQDLFPLFVHLVCTVKTNKIAKSQSVRSLPTCIFELMNQDNSEHIKNENFKNLKISLDVYCLMLPNSDIDDDDDEENDRHNKTNSPEQLHFPITTKSTTVQSTKQFEDYETPFAYLSSSLPLRHAQGLAAFIAEVEWSMRDEMAAGLLKDLTATPDTLEKIIEHVTNSPYSLSNEHEKIAVNFVVASPGTSKYNSDSLFLQKLDQLDIIIDVNNGDGMYTLVQCTNNIFYVVKKNMYCSNPDNRVSESPNMNYDLKTALPNFWLILKVESDQSCQKEYSDNNNTINTLIVNVYFHCRFTELDVQGRYSMIREVVGQNVRQAAITVNQILLLNRLYETKSCDSLLEPIIEDLICSDDDENSNSNNEMEKVIDHFSLGQFRCPVVWTTRFALHPRLRHTSNILLHGVQVLHNVLEKFSVRNRRNMFVYKESSGSVYYLRLYENSSPQQNQKNNIGDILQGDTDDEDSISRCSSATSTTVTVLSSLVPSTYSNPLQLRKFSEDLINTESKCTQTPGARSLGSHWGDIDSKDIEELILKVHGISHAGNEICIDLVQVLQNRLNDAVLEVLTTMIHRNPMCKLYPDDVYYVQPCDGHPDFTMKLSLPIETKITKSFNHNLKRSAAALLLFPPKYLSRHHKFNYIYDTIDNSDKPIIRSFFIYNQPGGLTSANGGMRGMSGNKGIACILYDIYSNKNNDSINNIYAYPTDPELFEKRIQTTCIGDDVRSIAGYSGYIKLYVWLRGRIPIDILQVTLTSIVTHSLWDVYMVHFLKKQPIIIEEPLEIYVNPLCIQYLTKWIAFGARISVPLSHHSQIECRLHINHVLREFKTHLSWFGTSVSKSLCVSVRYFYIPRMEYGESDDISNNVICGSSDPLELLQKQDNSLINNLVFYEWQIPNNNSTICPPSAACVLIIVSMSAPKKNKHHTSQNRDNELSDSDTDNGLNIPDDDENTNSEESNETLNTNNKTSTNDQSMTSNNNSNDSVKEISENNNKDYKKQHTRNTFSNKSNKLLLLCVSGQSVHTLSYNFRKNDDQPIAIHRLSQWLELRRNVFTLSIYDMMGLKNSQINDIFNGTGNKNIGINNNLDLLLDYKGYATTASEHELYDKIAIEKNSRLNTRTKSIDDPDDKKLKSLQYEKDEQDLFIEQLVRNSKQQRRIEIYYKMIYDMWIQKDANVTKDTLRAFYHQSRLLHYCLTPLLFLPWWRLESAATRDHLVDAVKTRSYHSIPSPQWHKRLCARLTSAFADYVQTNPLFTGFQLVQITKQRAFNDSGAVEIEQTKPTTCYFKKSIHGATGGLLLLETGVCQPFYYVKLCCIERSRLTNQVEYYEDKFKPQYSILDHSENIVRNMHLHSFTYDFHVRVLSDRLSNLVKKQKRVKRNNNCGDLSMLLEHRNSGQINANISESRSKKNAIAGFLDDFLMYYTLPPLYSSCLVLAGVIKRTQISVTGLQLYEYLLENCSEDCDGMAVIKICDSALVDGDDGASLFDDDDDDTDEADGEFMESQCSVGNDLTDFILVHHMAGSDIQQRQESEMNSNSYKLGIEANELHANCLFDACGLYDATLVMTLSSVKKLLLDTSNEITLSYYMLLTNNEDCNSDKKETISCNKTNCNMQQRHSTPIRPSVHGFDQTNNLLVSASVPNNSFGNVLNTDTSNCWGSLDENNSYNWSQIHTPPNHSPHLKKKRKKYHNYFDDDVSNHCQQTIKKTNLIKFYEKKAAELVAHTVDTAANRCRLHLLWKKFSIQSDQQKLGSTAITIDELKELVNKSAFLKPLSIYDRNLGPLVEELCKGPQWFTSLHKLINGQTSLTSSPTLSVQCFIYNSNISEQQYLVLLPNWFNDREINSFIIIDNGAVDTEKIADNSDSLINIVFRRNVIGSEEVNMLVETVAKSICFHIWRAVATSSATLTVSDS